MSIFSYTVFSITENFLSSTQAIRYAPRAIKNGFWWKIVLCGAALIFVFGAGSSVATPFSLIVDDSAFGSWKAGIPVENRTVPIIAELVSMNASGPQIVWRKRLEKPTEIPLNLKQGVYQLLLRDERSGIILRYPSDDQEFFKITSSQQSAVIGAAGARVLGIQDAGYAARRQRSKSLGTAEFFPRELIYRLTDGISLQEEYSFLSEYGLMHAERIYWSPKRAVEAFRATAGGSKPLEEIIRSIQADPRIVWVHPNQKLSAASIPNEYSDLDDLESFQWGLVRTKAYLAWETEASETVTPTIVAITDCGVALDHPDLVNKLWVNNLEDINGNGIFDDGDRDGIDQDGNGRVDDVNGWWFRDNFPDDPDPRPSPNDGILPDEAHGTHCAGIVGAEMNNLDNPTDTGVVGLSQHNRIMALRFDEDILDPFLDQIAASYYYAADNGANVISTSYIIASPYFSYGALQDAVETLWGENILIVAAVGNFGWSNDDNPTYPTGFDHVLSVAATTQEDNIASFSNYGSELDVCAPGVMIMSTYWDTGGVYNRAFKNGTSMACPAVAALAGMLYAMNPGISNQEVADKIRMTADKVGQYEYDINGWNQHAGYGRINFARALDYWSDSIFVDDSNSGTEDGSEEFPFNTIQEAIDVATDGADIIVADGTYYEGLSINKSVRVTSYYSIDSNPDHIAATVLDCTGQVDGIHFERVGVAGEQLIDGVAIRNASDWAIRIEDNHPIIRNSNIEFCANGINLSTYDANITLVNCNIRNNGGIGIKTTMGNDVQLDGVHIVSNGGGAIYGNMYDDINIVESVVADNGSGISLVSSHLVCVNATVANNGPYSDVCTQVRAKSTDLWGASVLDLTNTIIAGACDYGIYLILGEPYNWPAPPCVANLAYSSYEGALGMSGSNVYNIVAGCIATDPLFVDGSIGNYQLQTNSPCIDAGHPDLDGDGWDWESDVDDQDPDGSRLDMGAFYCDQPVVDPLPDCRVEPDILSFRVDQIGGQDAQTFVIFNDGGGTLEVAIVADSQEFVPFPNEVRISGGDYAVVTVTYMPGDNGNDTAVVEVGDSCATVACVASGPELLVPLWVEVASPAWQDSSNVWGVAWVDYDGDMDPDLYLARDGKANLLCRNEGNGAFTEVAATLIADSGPGCSSVWGDYDNDGRLDIYLMNNGTANRLIRNIGSEIFDDVTDDPLGINGTTVCGAWVDIDEDGLLDLSVVNNSGPDFLFRNEGANIFADVSPLALQEGGGTGSVTWVDYDSDGDQDMYLVVGSGPFPNRLLRNDGQCTFTDVSSGQIANSLTGIGAAWGDYDNDGDFDVYVTNFGEPNALLRNDRNGVFVEAAVPLVADEGTGTSCCWGDYDNDGWLDLFVANLTATNCLFHNDGGEGFSDATTGVLGDIGMNVGAAWADYDRDGDMDLFVTEMNGYSRLLQNCLEYPNHWIQFELAGTISNRAAIGATVRIVTSNHRQIRSITAGSGFVSQNSALVEFGLGGNSVVDTVQIVWPYRLHDGLRQTTLMTAVAADQCLTVTEPAIPSQALPNPTAAIYCLYQCSPNPFNPQTTIAFEVPRQETVTLRVFDVAGRLVKVLVDGEVYDQGRHEAVWRGADDSGRQCASGTYFYRLEAREFSETKSMVLIK